MSKRSSFVTYKFVHLEILTFSLHIKWILIRCCQFFFDEVEKLKFGTTECSEVESIEFYQ